MQRWLTLLLLACAGPVLAAKSDRDKPIQIECEHDMLMNSLSRRTECNGPVLLVRGSLQLRASRLEVEQRQDNSAFAVAAGKPNELVRFSQSLDTPGLTIEGSAERIEYDDRAETVRFAGAATVRRMKGSAVMDELTGAAIIYNSRSEILSVEPGQTSPQANGKVRVVLMPRQSAASAPEAPPSAVPLQTAPALKPASAPR